MDEAVKPSTTFQPVQPLGDVKIMALPKEEESKSLLSLEEMAKLDDSDKSTVVIKPPDSTVPDISVNKLPLIVPELSKPVVEPSVSEETPKEESPEMAELKKLFVDMRLIIGLDAVEGKSVAAYAALLEGDKCVQDSLLVSLSLYLNTSKDLGKKLVDAVVNAMMASSEEKVEEAIVPEAPIIDRPTLPDVKREYKEVIR